MRFIRRCAVVAVAAMAFAAGSMPAAHAVTEAKPGKPSGAAANYDYCRDHYWDYEQSWPPPTVRQGMVDTTYPSAVILAQCYLNLVLNPARHGQLAQDGHFGPRTRQQVQVFQADWCADIPPVDGIVGPMTWAGLQSWATSQYYAC
jgi:peptidoglycan hydrolase-like protein with peptidoglycan-binding domain